jgi:preprotein translocase subunit SecG
MKYILSLLQIILSVVVIVLILLQSKGVGLGRAWGGSADFYKTRRGIEKIVFQATILFVFLFLLVSITNLIID